MRLKLNIVKNNIKTKFYKIKMNQIKQKYKI